MCSFEKDKPVEHIRFHLPKTSCSLLCSIDLWLDRTKGRAYIDGHGNSPNIHYTRHNGCHPGNALTLNHLTYPSTKREFFLSCGFPYLSFFCRSKFFRTTVLGEINQPFFLFQQESHVAQAALELWTPYVTEDDLGPRSSCFHPLGAGIPGMRHHACLPELFLREESINPQNAMQSIL